MIYLVNQSVKDHHLLLSLSFRQFLLKTFLFAYLLHFEPHQANKRIIDATANRMGVGEEQVMLNIHRYGNTTNGTIPLCLWEWEKDLKKGDNLILSAFGGGFTWGSVYLKWAYDSQS